MRIRTLVLTTTALALAVTGCSTDTSTGAPASSSSAASTARDTADSARQLGETIAFTRTDTSAPVGRVTFTDAVVLPAECNPSTRAGQVLALRVVIQNAAGEQLPVPDVYQLSAGGAAVETAKVYGCASRFPEVATAAPGGSAEGWFAVRTSALPDELVYAPMVGDQASTADDIRVLTVAPSSVRVALPDLTAATSAEPAPPSTTVPAPAPAPTTARPAPTYHAPPTGRDSEGRPQGSGGALVECAGEDYQPGTGIFADGSRGFAAECLPGGTMAPS